MEAVTSDCDGSLERDVLELVASVFRASCSSVAAKDLSTCEQSSVVCARMLSSSNSCNNHVTGLNIRETNEH